MYGRERNLTSTKCAEQHVSKQVNRADQITVLAPLANGALLSDDQQDDTKYTGND